MLLRRTIAALLSVTAVHAFKDATPFMVFSTESFDDAIQSREVVQAKQVVNEISSVYEKRACKAATHMIISQPGLKAEDGLKHMPKLQQWLRSRTPEEQIEMANVIGQLDPRSIAASAAFECDAAAPDFSQSAWDDWSPKASSGQEQTFVYLEGTDLPSRPQDREQEIRKLDAKLEKKLSSLPVDGSFVLIFMSAPASSAQNKNPETDELVGSYPPVRHQDLKRHVDVHIRASNGSSNSSDNFQDGLPLFEKYQYLSPALFMGLAVSLFLFILLYVAISSIAGLEVSYMAFSKEMAPQNQKGKQQ